MAVIKTINTNNDLDYPTIEPTLDLNFALTKTLDPRITYSRNSVGTYVGSDGLIKTAVANEPRFDHDPVTGKCLGLLLEESRINRIANSTTAPVSTFGTSNTIGSNCLVAANTAIAPDGTLTAYTVNPRSPFAYVGIDPNVFSVVLGQTYTASIWIKKIPGITYQNLSMVVNDWASPKSFDYSSTLNASTDWIRISYSFTSNVTADRGIWLIRQNSGGTVPSQPLYVWGPQIEEGSFPTSYIPTSGSTITRDADFASITGKNFSNWFNYNEGTLFCDFLNQNTSDFRPVWQIRNSGGDGDAKGIMLQKFGTTYGFRGGNAFNNLSISSLLQRKITASSWTENGTRSFYLNGSSAGTSNVASYSGTPTSLLIGNGDNAFATSYVSNNPATITYSRLTYYPKRLSDSQLQLLTQN